MATCGAFLYCNGRVVSRNEKRTAAAVLKSLPKGAYTTLRVEKLRDVVDWDLHVNRLNKSVALLAENVNPSIRRLGFSPQGLRQRVGEDLKTALLDVEATVDAEGLADQMVVILLPQSTQEATVFADVYVYVRLVPAMGLNAAPIEVWAQGKGRSLPEAKDSKWVQDRMPLEQQMPDGCQEVILMNAQGGLLEGLTSNFYVVRDVGGGTELQTTGLEEGILAGVFRRVLIDAVQSSSVLQLNVNENFPKLSETHTWTEAFISNSLTGIRPIKKFIMPDGKSAVEFRTVPGEVTSQLIFCVVCPEIAILEINRAKLLSLVVELSGVKRQDSVTEQCLPSPYDSRSVRFVRRRHRLWRAVDAIMPRTQRIQGTPAQAVLLFLDDVLASRSPQCAADFLGFPPYESSRPGRILEYMLERLYTPNSAIFEPDNYRATLHALNRLMRHAYYAPHFQEALREGGNLCEQLFKAGIAANTATQDFKTRPEELKFWTYRADVYGVLAACLENVQSSRDTGRNVLLQLFRSFFSPEGSPLMNDLEQLQPWMIQSFDSDETLGEIRRVFAAMADFVQSIAKHGKLLDGGHEGATSIFTGLGTACISMARNTFALRQCEELNEALCRMTASVLEYLSGEVARFHGSIEEMLREKDIVQTALLLVTRLENRMATSLKTQVLRVSRATLLLTLQLPESYNFRSGIRNEVAQQSDSMTSILSKHLEIGAELMEMHVVLFDTVSLLFEFRAAEATLLRPAAFIEAVHLTLPLLARRIGALDASLTIEIDLMNAEIVFLHKLMTPSEGFHGEMWDLVTTALQMVMESNLFGIMISRWPPENQEEIEKARTLQPTVRLGLNLVLNALHRHGTAAMKDWVLQLFLKHREEFESALKMGLKATVIFWEWKPAPGDKEIAQLIEVMIRNSAVYKRQDLMSHLDPLLPSANSDV